MVNYGLSVKVNMLFVLLNKCYWYIVTFFYVCVVCSCFCIVMVELYGCEEIIWFIELNIFNVWSFIEKNLLIIGLGDRFRKVNWG